MVKLAEVQLGKSNSWFCETLYYDVNSKSFYLHGRGGSTSVYGKCNEKGEWSAGEKLSKFPKELVLEWLEVYGIEMNDEISDSLKEAE